MNKYDMNSALHYVPQQAPKSYAVYKRNRANRLSASFVVGFIVGVACITTIMCALMIVTV